MRTPCLVALVACGCTVGDRYLVAPGTLAAVTALPYEERVQTVAPAARAKTGVPVLVRSDAFSLSEARPAPDGRIAIPTRLGSRKLALGHTLVWLGTPLSIAGLCMVIWGRDAVRWTGIPLAAVAEPLMIAGTVLWIQAARSRPQEVPPGEPDLRYLPEPGASASLAR